jgi:DOPA 4,5-dioxygenase
VAVPLSRVNVAPIGPHPAGSYEIWVPRESFAEVFSFMALNHGELSVLVHPLTRHEREDHSSRKAWIGQPWPILLDQLPEDLETVPLQYPTLGKILDFMSYVTHDNTHVFYAHFLFQDLDTRMMLPS